MSVVVIGATGNVGRAAAWGFLSLKSVQQVFIVGRSGDKLDELKKTYLGDDARVVPIVADVTTALGAEEAWNQISLKSEKKGIDHLVSSSGPW
jgi:short-subunit dehydrogenase